MKISILTLFKELYQPFIATSLLRKAQEEGLVSFDIESLFSFCKPKERVDAPTFGHTAGMLIKPEVIEKALDGQAEKHGKPYTIFFSPKGTLLTQHELERIYQKAITYDHIALVAPRYEGVDARVEEEYADEIISIGNFVLMGGDIPAMTFLEGFLRLLPGVVGDKESVDRDSFTGPLVDYPEYTMPVDWRGKTVPTIIRSGNHKAIEQWRNQQALQATVLGHFDWLRSHVLPDKLKERALDVIPAHYCALMHDQVCLPNDQVGTSSVTSIDLHDIARSAHTYGLKHYFVVTPLEDQQKIVKTILNFWHTSAGQEYNPHRSQAVAQLGVENSLTAVIEAVEKKEGIKPIVIATAARAVGVDEKNITYFDQEKVWRLNRPVVLVFGTARGLSQAVIDRCDYILAPIYGFSKFNHLSVRSAAAVIFDRWLGINPKY